MSNEDVTDHASFLPESESKSEPEPVAEEYVPESESTSEPESKSEPEPVAEEPKSIPEPENSVYELDISAVAVKQIPIIYVATSEPHDRTWRCVCTII